MMKNYGTPASEGDVQRAQFLNYLKAPKPLQQAMQQYAPSSDAYMKIQNSMASAQEDMGIRQGTPQPARDFLASQQSPQAADLVQRTVGGLGPNHPLTTMLSPQGEAERAARRQERLDRRTTVPQQPVNARGVAGATFGTVNGQQMLVPEAGQYGQFRQSMGQLGLDGTMGVERGAFEGARSKLVRTQEYGRKQAKKEATDAATAKANAAALQRAQDMEDKILLETIKNHGVNAPGISDWMQTLNQTKKEQAAYDEITAATRGKQPDEPVQIGNEFRTVGEWRAQLSGKPRPSLQPYQTWQASQGQLGDPRFAGAGGPAPTAPKTATTTAPTQGARLGPNAKTKYKAMTPQDREKYAAYYEDQGDSGLAAEIRGVQ